MVPKSDTKSRGHLLSNVVLFCRVLRQLGAPTTPTQLIHLVDALKHINIGQRRDFKNTTRTTLINRQEYFPLFDLAFDLFWRVHHGESESAIDLGSLLRRSPQVKEHVTLEDREDHGDDQSDFESEYQDSYPAYSYSSREVLRQKDFSQLTSEELMEVKKLMHTIVWKLESRRSRRKIRGSTKAYLDLRRTLRQSLRYGGEPILLSWRQRKEKRRRLVVICDVSGSMELYSRLLLRFLYLITRGLHPVESFVFGTRLTRITYQLKGANIDGALARVTQGIQDWAGGTRIGECLKSFNYEWGRRLLGQGAIVLIISDGWDRGNVELLAREMARLQRSCRRLIWLNPLLGSPRYEPLTRGMQVALPRIDYFLPVHNLASLEQLARLLGHFGEHRPPASSNTPALSRGGTDEQPDPIENSDTVLKARFTNNARTTQ